MKIRLPPQHLITDSEAKTIACGRKLGRWLSDCIIKKRRSAVVGLTGKLGAGKTKIAGGIFRGAGLPSTISVTSPTFTVINPYLGPIPMYHVDFFRLNSPSEAVEAGVEEIIHEEQGLIVIEWFEKFPSLYPESYIKVGISIIGEKRRKIDISFFNMKT